MSATTDSPLASTAGRHPRGPGRRSGLLLLLCCLWFGCSPPPAQESGQPNIILVITDDQGWAQLGSHGDDILRTPHLDRLAAQSMELTRFYVSPVCAPTRASLMTGRYNYRTGVVDTYVGRAMMHSDEVTLAETLSEAGYRTGIFGKWHLGDNYPLRAMDQGFQESVVHKGGGIGQPSDPPETSYFDPILQHNGEAKPYPGYCTDIFFQEALEFIEQNRDSPFFAYIPTNAPHSPYDVPESYRQSYLEAGLEDKDARIYGMITNIDDNVGRLMEGLERLELEENTILIFMTDNGATTQRYTAGLRGLKGTVYDGGIRVPFLLRWPGRLEPGADDRIAAHIDLMPTLLEAAGVAAPDGAVFDGVSLMSRLGGNNGVPGDRTLFIQSHRGNEPQPFRHFAAIEQRYKLVQPVAFATRGLPPGETFEDYPLELYDLEADPGEKQDISGGHPQVVARLRSAYADWLQDVSSTRGYAPPRIAVGTVHEDPVILTRQDWRMVGPDGWRDTDLGFWEIQVHTAGTYRIRFLFGPASAGGKAELRIQQVRKTRTFAPGTSEVMFDRIRLDEGGARLEAVLQRGGKPGGVRYVEVSLIQSGSGTSEGR